MKQTTKGMLSAAGRMLKNVGAGLLTKKSVVTENITQGPGVVVYRQNFPIVHGVLLRLSPVRRQNTAKGKISYGRFSHSLIAFVSLRSVQVRGFA